MQVKDPFVFGPHGGLSRVFSMLEVAFSLGLMLGPLISGTLTEAFGYYSMNCTLSE
jgi:MFS family permease